MEFLPIEGVLIIRDYKMFFREFEKRIRIDSILNIHLYESKEFRHSPRGWRLSKDFIIYGITKEKKLIKITSYANFYQYEKCAQYIVEKLEKSVPVLDLNELKSLESRISYENDYKLYIIENNG